MIQPLTTQSGPIQSESIQSESIQSESIQSEPIQSEPTQLDKHSTIQPHRLKLSSGRTRTRTAVGHSADNSKRRQISRSVASSNCLGSYLFGGRLHKRYQHLSMVLSYFPYKVGGSLTWNDPSYLKRKADLDLQTALRQGRFAYVLGPRQIGKSSLRIQAAHQLAQSGNRCASVQATQLKSDDEQDFLCSLYIALIADDLKSFLQWLALTTELSPIERLTRFVDDFLADLLSMSPIVVFIDEIDAILETPLNSVLFAWIAKCYELRAINSIYQRLNFVVLGTVIASDLPQSGLLLPRGCEISLSPFQLAETYALQAGFENRLETPEVLMGSIYRWTHGQPFLTQKLCYIISGVIDNLLQPSAKPIQISSKVLSQWVDEVVRSHIIQSWQTKDEPIHLRAIGRRIYQSFNKKALLQLYREVLLDKPVKVSDSYTQAELILSGLVIVEDDELRVANEIYRSIFQVR